MPNIRHNLLIGASAKKVYNAITTREGLSAWWTAGTHATAEVNGIARFEFGEGYFKEMKIVELKSSEVVKWICIKGADEWIGTTISFSLQAGDKDTLMQLHPEASDQIHQQSPFDTATFLIFRHDDWKAYTPTFAECNYTWGQFLRSLKSFCETGSGRPWPNQHELEP